MWTLIILFVGAVLYFNFFYKETKGKISKQKSRSPHSKGKNSEAKLPDADWVFKREIDQPGVPTVINNYRKLLNGYDYKKIVRSIKGIAKIEDDVKRNLGYLQFAEPLAELQRNGNFEMNEDMPQPFFDSFYFEVFTYLDEYFPAIGARGQIKNLEDICNFIPELSGFEAGIDYTELDAHDEILKVIKRDGLIYAKDLKMLNSYNQVKLKEYLINRMLSHKVIEQSKEGRYNIYKLKV